MARRRTKIGEADRRRIVELVGNGKTNLEISRRLNVDERVVSWFAGPPRKKIDPPDKAQIIELARQGVPNVKIARDLNVHGHTVNGIIFNARKRGILPGFSQRPKSASRPPASIHEALPSPLPVPPPPPILSRQPDHVMVAVQRVQIEHLQEQLRTKGEEVDSALRLVSRLVSENDSLRSRRLHTNGYRKTGKKRGR